MVVGDLFVAEWPPSMQRRREKHNASSQICNKNGEDVLQKMPLFYVTALAGAAFFAASTCAQAQSATPAAGTQQATSTLSEVVVTAQHRNQRLEEVPIAVTAVLGKDLAKSGVTGLQDLQTIAPAFQMGQSGVFGQLSIRGITSTALGPGIENNIAEYIDGFYEPSSTALSADFNNVNDIQVLKGPQGALYGRNATGGALLINTYDPSLNHPIIEAGASYGNLNDRRVNGYISVPLTQNIAFGIGANYHANDGYIKNIDGTNASPFSETEVRAKLRWEPTSNISFILGQNHFYKSDPLGEAYNFIYSPIGLPVGPLYANQRDRVSDNVEPLSTVREDETTLRARWITGYGTVTSHTSYSDERDRFDADYDGTLINVVRIPASNNRHTFIEQLDYDVKPISTFELQVGGLYYSDSSSTNISLLAVNPPTQPVYGLFEHYNTAMKTTAYAGYVDATWEAAPHVFLNAGVRYSNDRRTINAYYLYLNPNLLESDPTYPILAPPTSANFPAVTPRATIRWEFAPRTDVYVSYTQGFKSGTFNGGGSSLVTLTTPVQPERVSAYEVGFKTASGPFHLETAAYYYDYKDLQVNALSTDANQNILLTLTNAATAKIWGLEASGAWAVTSDFNVRAGAAYTHARYGSFDNSSVSLPFPFNNPNSVITAYPCPDGRPAATCAPGTMTTLAGLGTAVAGSALTENLSGHRIARAPDVTANIGADYTVHFNAGKVILAANGYYTSRYAPESEAYNPTNGQPYYYNKGYFLANASVDYMTDHYSVGFYVKNIGDTRFLVVNQSSAFGYQRVWSSPTTYGVRVKYSY